MHDLRVVLHTSHAQFSVLERSDRRTLGGRGDLETCRSFRNGIAVAHPHRVPLSQAGVEHTPAHLHVGAAVLTRTGLGHGTAQRLGHHLEAVANAEGWQAELQNLRIELRSAFRIDRRRPARKHKRNRILGFQFLGCDRVRHDLGVNARFTHATGNELRILRAEVHDKNRARVRVGSRRVSHGFKV